MLESTIERLRADARTSSDATGYFAAMYARVTDRVDAAIADGRFDDGIRMAEFARTFADWYLEPRAGSRPTPTCWQAAAEVASDSRLLIVQHLLLGINAHVNHDLPQVVAELAGDGPIEPLRSDFDAINDILAETQSEILRDLGRVSGWTRWLVSGGGGGRLFDFSLGRAREQAWATAVRFHGVAGTSRAVRAAELDEIVAVLAYLITRPSLPVRGVLAVLRRFEDHDAPSVTRRLLAHLA